MSKKALVVVESPSKAKTIQKYLGRDYIVKASVGHIQDLPKSKLGVDIDNGFEPDYQMIPGKVKVVEELKKAYEKAPLLLLATDPDREGEAIAWHINDALKTKGKKSKRVLFNAITKPAILEAIANPLELNTDKIDAQQARRILDRLVGYKISPLLWDKVRRGISAGRVQSVALRLIVERESEIKAFKADEYWEISGIFSKNNQDFATKLFKIDGVNPEISNENQAKQWVDKFTQAAWNIKSIEKKERTRRPTPPFITSRLQQEASRKLGFGAKRTMGIAQKLYEGVDLGDLGTHGLITYMRTDSVRVEPTAIESVRSYIKSEYGARYLPSEPNLYKTKKSAQDAHEAIRPTSMEFSPDRIKNFLEKDELKLYTLIWNRFVSSQMTPAIYDQTAVDVAAKVPEEIIFRATGSVVKFDGFTVIYSEDKDDSERKAQKQETEENDQDGSTNELKLPPIQPGDKVLGEKFNPSQHFTQPPPRYTDASLIKELEEKGIGRPSTYATILTNLQDREYVERRENKYFPSELGVVVTDLLVQSFPDILNTEFTANMETQLDDIEEGNANWKKTLSKFWKSFEKTLESAKKHMKNVKQQQVPTDIDCERCQSKMVIKWGKMGSFLACSNYPECKNTQDFTKDDNGKIIITPKEYTDKKCEKCSSSMVVKSGKFGKFLACSDYPNCKSTLPMGTGIHCPDCKDGEICERQSRFRRLFYSCSKWPDCKFAMWDKPIDKPCPQCKSPFLTAKFTKRTGLLHKCPKKECGYFEVVDTSSVAG